MHYPKLASKTLSLCLKRMPGDWQAILAIPFCWLEPSSILRAFKHPYKASNWLYRAIPRILAGKRQGYRPLRTAPKMLFVFHFTGRRTHRTFSTHTRILTSSELQNLCWPAEKMQSLYDYVYRHPRPRRVQGGAIHCPPCWPSPRGRCCAAWRVIRPYGTGPRCWPQGPGAFSLPLRKGSFRYPVESISVMCLSAGSGANSIWLATVA